MLRSIRFTALPLTLVAASTTLTSLAVENPVPDHTSGRVVNQTSKKFQGVKANTGTVTLSLNGGQYTLALSTDFKTPDAPAPHWQIVDSKGDVFLLQRLMVKDAMGKPVGDKPAEKLNSSIVVPTYIHDIAKVQIWCAFAESVLGETTFDSVIMLDPMVDSMGAMHMSTKFAGVKVNTGSVSHAHINGKSALTLSDDFKIPDAPAPHWQLVDSNGNTYLLDRLVVKGDTFHKTLEVPAYVPDVKKVQIWCAWAEALLGEAEFETPVR